MAAPHPHPCRRWLLVALLAHLLLAGTYAWRTPAWEGPDENDHAFYAMFLNATGRQPNVLASSAQTGRPSHEEAALGHHPPLYYWLVGRIAALCGHADITPYWRPNSAYGTSQRAGALKWQHGHDESTLVSTEIRVLVSQRWFSVLVGGVTIVLTFALARALFVERPRIAVLAALWLATWPQWSFMHGVLDNGNLATTLATGTALLLVRALQHGFTSMRALCLGAVLGAALLTKLTALFLVPLTMIAVGLAWTSRRVTWPDALRFLAISAAVALALSGAWFWRNHRLYGDALALAPHAIAYASNRVPEGMLASYLTGDFPRTTLQSLFAGIGWSLRLAPSWTQWCAVALCVAGALGLGWRLRPLLRGRACLVALVSAAVLLPVAGVVQFNLTFIQPQGRYLFPGLPGLLVLLAAGLDVLGVRSALFALVLLPGAVLLQHAWFLPQLVPDSPPHAHYASYIAGLRSPAPAETTALTTLGPADGHVSELPVVLMWRDETAPPDTAYTVHLALPDSLTVGSFETAGILLSGSSWPIPDYFWTGLPKDVPVRWRVRRVANRSRGEAQEAQPCSPWQTIVRR